MTTQGYDWQPLAKATADLNNFKEKDNESQALRYLLIEDPMTEEELEDLWTGEFRDSEFWPVDFDTFREIETAIEILRSAPYNLGRDHLTELAIALSLCPVHFVDWAICFDDQPQDCEQIRAIFPHHHDT